MDARHDHRMDDDLVEVRARRSRARIIARCVLWNGLKVPNIMPMPRLGASFERMSESNADRVHQRAERRAADQEDLAGDRNARRCRARSARGSSTGRAGRCGSDRRRHAAPDRDPRYCAPCDATVVIRAATAIPPTEATPSRLSAPPHRVIPNTARLNTNCGKNRPSRPIDTNPNRLLVQSSALLLNRGVARQNTPINTDTATSEWLAQLSARTHSSRMSAGRQKPPSASRDCAGSGEAYRRSPT